MIPGWKEEFEGEYLQILREIPKASPSDFSLRLDVSECCAIYWLTELAKEGRVRILAVELVKDGEVPCEQQSFLTCQRKATCPALSRAELA
jgi:hypothetical protein